MAVFLGAVWLVLRTIVAVLALLLAILLVLLTLVLLLPVGVQLDYARQVFSLRLLVGPVRWQLLPRRKKAGQAKGKTKAAPAQKAPATVQNAPAGTPAPDKKALSVLSSDQTAGTAQPHADVAGTPQQSVPADAPKTGRTVEQAASQGSAAAPDATAQAGGTAELAGKAVPAEPAEEPPGLVERVIAAAKAQPLAFAQAALGHTGWLLGRLLNGIRVRGLTVYWTVTAADAASTAIQYGAMIATANQLLAFLQTKLEIRSESLRIEPDFTGEQKEKRCLRCQISARVGALLIPLLRGLWRVWRDPAFGLRKPRKTTQH